jgi:uncharacterized protein YjbI with pentapeptide repeats
VHCEHILWNDSHHREGARAVFEEADFSNLLVNPEQDITDFFKVSSAVTGQQYVIETFQPKGPIPSPELGIGIDFSGIVFKKCILDNVNLRSLKFDQADFSGSSLRGAILTDSSFKRLTFAELTFSMRIWVGQSVTRSSERSKEITLSPFKEAGTDWVNIGR